MTDRTNDCQRNVWEAAANRSQTLVGGGEGGCEKNLGKTTRKEWKIVYH